MVLLAHTRGVFANKKEGEKGEGNNKRSKNEREHSMSAAHAHIDWFEKDGIKFCAISG